MATTPTFNWPTPDDTDLVRDGAAAIRDLGDAIDTTLSNFTTGPFAQIVTAVLDTGDFSTTSSDFTATGLKATITPTDANSTLMIHVVGGVRYAQNSGSPTARSGAFDIRDNTNAARVGRFQFLGRDLVSSNSSLAASWMNLSYVIFVPAVDTNAREYELRMQTSTGATQIATLRGNVDDDLDRASMIITEILP